VRLADADALAIWLLGMPLDTFGASEEQRVDLAKPTPVYILYLTVEPRGGQGLTVHPDIYGKDPIG
jgi:murein L,D-transpeptidase YcbB/YkuD